MNKLEQLQKQTNGFEFIKSYPILRKTKMTPTEVSIVELILSYQDNGQQFFMNYSDISDILNVGKQTIKDKISDLRKKGYINTNHTKNYKNGKGGSTTTIIVDIDFIIDEINGVEVAPKPSKEVKEDKPTQPTQVVVEEPVEEITEEVVINEELKTKPEEPVEEVDNHLIIILNQYVNNKQLDEKLKDTIINNCSSLISGNYITSEKRLIAEIEYLTKNI